MTGYWKFAYVSDVVDHRDHIFSEILEVSRRNNRAEGVTGILLNDDRKYFQYIEGPMTPVAQTALRIAGDSRHTHMTPILSMPTDCRLFEGWSLAEARLPKRKQSLAAFQRLLMGLDMPERRVMVDAVCLASTLIEPGAEPELEPEPGISAPPVPASAPQSGAAGPAP